MQFKIRTFTKTRDFVNDRPVNWITAVREELGCGLREAKDLCDTLRAVVREAPIPHRITSVMVDTQKLPFLNFLEHCVAPKDRHIVDGIKSATVPKSADDLLKTTAIKLIRMDEFSKAIDVLKIVI